MSVDFTLKVTPEELLAEAENVQGHISALQNKFSVIGDAVSRSEGYWTGEAGDAHRRTYRGRQEEIDKIFQKLGEQVSDLQAMARGYQETEEAVETAADGLPDNVLI